MVYKIACETAYASAVTAAVATALQEMNAIIDAKTDVNHFEFNRFIVQEGRLTEAFRFETQPGGTAIMKSWEVNQQALIRAVHAANPNTVVVIVGGYPFAVNWEQEHVPSIVFTSHAGQELGYAVADVLYGDYNPGGRLNMTWYQSSEQLPDIMDYDIIKGKRTYQYFEGNVLYPFGHSLSYSHFSYSGLALSQSNIRADGQVTVTLVVKNEGHLPGDEVVQLYVKADSSRVIRPLKTLKGFRRIHLQPNASETVSFELKAGGPGLLGCHP
ncbi:glycoside hydrolase family 3 C-terminal domain-containing protein [Paenibacillus glucanolyticus]|uniref:glycoside hydrolase family 3 C-terminal domain-containing protein n=1 Tax=Paenibacillus glucanolyticus TaxID=59843 RepID=UPI0030C9983F